MYARRSMQHAGTKTYVRGVRYFGGVGIIAIKSIAGDSLVDCIVLKRPVVGKAQHVLRRPNLDIAISDSS